MLRLVAARVVLVLAAYGRSPAPVASPAPTPHVPDILIAQVLADSASPQCVAPLIGKQEQP